jgi:penicillin-binding protein A
MRMSKQIRNLGMALMVCYLALFIQLNRWTVFDSRSLQENPNNTREAERDFSAPRGTISTMEGVVLAESVDSNDRFERQRRYPQGDLFGQITGYFSPLWVGTAGLERQYNDELAGRNLEVNLDTVDDLFTESDRVGNLTLTMRADVQQAARDALGGNRGSVVVLDPRSGGIIALYSNPTYDPNPLAVHNSQQATAAAEALAAQTPDPRRSRAYQDRFAPGSTFKVVTATAGLESGTVTPDNPDYPDQSSYVAPNVGGTPIPNFGGGSCGGTLFSILAESCNTAFAQMGTEQVGHEGMLRQAQAFGFNQDVPIDLPRPSGQETQVESVFPELTQDDQFLAQSSIGQYQVEATPLQMALVAAGVANGGEIMTPHVLSEISDADNEEISDYDQSVWTRAMSEQTASVMQEAMYGVVDGGTATRLAEGIDGSIAVGGKTGTAQTGNGVHAWIIGFAGPEGGEPELAFAVMLESQPGVNDEQTGGQVAAPVANQVLQVALQPPPTPQGQTTDEGQPAG